MKLTDIVSTPEAVKGYYPTPFNLATKLLRDVDWKKISQVLEPSAGNGNLIDAIGRLCGSDNGGRGSRITVDAIEIDEALRVALLARFGEERKATITGQLNKLRDINLQHNRWAEAHGEWRAKYFPDGEPPKYTEAMEAEATLLRMEQSVLERTKLHLVHDDFLTFGSMKRYDLVVMNPPFANGDVHLLKAIAMQERYGGQIRCILNAETLRNPFSLQRQRLVNKLAELGAEIEYIEDAFRDAERSARVDVALIRVNIPNPENKSDIFDRLTKAAEEKPIEVDACEDLALNDLFARYVSMFDVEVQAGLELIKSYRAMCPHILNSMIYERSEPIITLKILGSDARDAVNEYVCAVREKYWAALLHNPEFVDHLTADMRNDWRSKIEQLADYDFTVFNIRKVMVEINGQLRQGVETAIEKVFKKLTEDHAWYADAKTIHYFTGWRTNKAHMIGKKCIIPSNGAYASDSIWGGDKFDSWRACDALRDIEKVLDFFDGEGIYATVDMHEVMAQISESHRNKTSIPPKNIKLKHFSVTFYKKGTVHITFHDQKLVDRVNIYCARQANELPPDYGRKPYSDLEGKEKEVIDSFHGDGTDGSGKKAYTAVYENQALYLAGPSQQSNILALPTQEA